MSSLCIVRFPMERRADIDYFLDKVRDRKTHVNENGVEGTIDVYVVGTIKEVKKLSSSFNLKPSRLE